MKAAVYHGPFDLRVEDVPEPKLEEPTDAVVRITSTAICGSDLHMYEGRTDAEPGLVFGHENLGVIEEVGSGVTAVSPGDRVVLPFNVACGFCDNCEARQTAFCLTANPPYASAAYGYVGMGPYSGGQAEFLRVPFADFNALTLPPDGEHETDFVLLADIFPTGYHATEMAEVSPGDRVAVYGAGPVGLMAAYSARLRGAERVFVVDKVRSRLSLAEQIGAVPVDFTDVDPVDYIVDATEGYGSDKGVDAVGYQATASDSDEEQPAIVLNQLIHTVRHTGLIGTVGLYLSSDPGAPSDAAKQGRLQLEVGRFFEKGLRIGMGQCNTKRYNRQLRDLIIAGRAQPSFLVSKELPLDDAPDAYRRFDRREEGYSKVVLHP